MIVDGKEVEGIRLKTVKLRGQLSQGLLMPMPKDLAVPEDGDVTELMGVIKYEAPIAPQLSGQVKGNFPDFIPKTDEERIQNMKDVLGAFYVTEKLDGTSVTYYKYPETFGVCSRNLELKMWKQLGLLTHLINLVDTNTNSATKTLILLN